MAGVGLLERIGLRQPAKEVVVKPRASLSASQSSAPKKGVRV